jgi:hypothetical protein
VKNGAGLENTGCSDGAVFHFTTELTEQSIANNFFVVNPIGENLIVCCLPCSTEIQLIDATGRVVLKSTVMSAETFILPVSLSSGYYSLIAALPDGRRFCRKVVSGV